MLESTLPNLLARLPPQERLGVPVLPGALPVVGHALYQMGDAVTFLSEAARTYGPLYWLRNGADWTLMCMGQPGFDLLKNRVTTNTYLREQSQHFVGDSLLAQDGTAHRHVRSAMNGPFTPRGISSSSAGTLSAEVIEARVASFPERPFSLLGETQALALDIIFRVMGIERSEMAEWNRAYRQFVLSVMPIQVDLPLFPQWWGRRGKAWLDERFTHMIAAARAGQGLTGMLAALIEAKDDEGKGLGNKELLENLRLLALAGHETSASVMAWAGIVLAQEPEMWERLRDEATAAANVPRTFDELKRHPYAEALFRETLRLYPPLSLTARMTTEDVELHGVPIPRGTLVGIPVGVYGRDEAFYPEPERFNPERWLGRGTPPTALELAPFGGGPHFCLGYHLAWLEVVQFLTAWARDASRRGLRPMLAPGEKPVRRYRPFGQPPKGTRLKLVRA